MQHAARRYASAARSPAAKTRSWLMIDGRLWPRPYKTADWGCFIYAQRPAATWYCFYSGWQTVDARWHTAALAVGLYCDFLMCFGFGVVKCFFFRFLFGVCFWSWMFGFLFVFFLNNENGFGFVWCFEMYNICSVLRIKVFFCASYLIHIILFFI